MLELLARVAVCCCCCSLLVILVEAAEVAAAVAEAAEAMRASRLLLDHSVTESKIVPLKKSMRQFGAEFYPHCQVS